jgi:hypothetical protein
VVGYLCPAKRAMSRIAIVIPYFNPVGHRSGPAKLRSCLDAFSRAGAADDVFIAGTGTDPPKHGNIVFWDHARSFMWHKERLINLVAKRLPSTYTHVVWADSDVLIADDWPTAVERAFRRSRLVQCFRAAAYRTSRGEASIKRASCLIPSVDSLQGAIGLVWRARLSLFVDGPGLFEWALVGGG